MKYAVLGTGAVGQTIAAKLRSQGYEVLVGSRSAGEGKVSFAEAAAFGHIIFNATKGEASLQALALAGEGNLGDKILIDLANPLDFSRGMPPTLSICNDDSLGETIQRTYPRLKVVKTLNTLNCALMVNPSAVGGSHDLFMSGNDPLAKAEVHKLLASWGWKTIHDLGDISTARGTEQLLPIWIRLMGSLGHADFNFHIAQAARAHS